MVIQDSNFRQIPQFIHGIDYDADDIVLRPIFKWFGMNEDEVLYKNVLNPCHPYYKEYMKWYRIQFAKILEFLIGGLKRNNGH